MERKIARISALIYTFISLVLVAVFLIGAYLTGVNYPPVALIGGATWVFVLSMIITMPLVIPYVRKKIEG